MITPQVRDEILKYLVSTRNGLHTTIKCKDAATALNIEEAFIVAILSEFEKENLIMLMSIADGVHWYSVTLTAKAIEYSQTPWFQAKAEVERMQIEKLIEELDQIKNQIGLERYNSVINSLSLIVGVFGLVSSK